MVVNIIVYLSRYMAITCSGIITYVLIKDRVNSIIDYSSNIYKKIQPSKGGGTIYYIYENGACELDCLNYSGMCIMCPYRMVVNTFNSEYSNPPMYASSTSSLAAWHIRASGWGQYI